MVETLNDIQHNRTYKYLSKVWYLLMPFLPLWLGTLFYRHYYDSTDIFILVDVYTHYISKLPDELFNLPWHIYVIYPSIVFSCLFLLVKNPFAKLYKSTKIFGNARFAKIKDVIKIGLLDEKGKEHKNGTIICDAKIGSWFFKKRLLLNEPLSVLLLAPPGTGKTAGVAIPSLLVAKNSVVCLDVKGELFDLTSKHRNSFSDVMVFDPVADNTSKWNPLDKTALPENYAARYVHVQNIGATIYVIGKSDPYWPSAARTMFHAITMALIHRDGGTTIPAVKQESLPKSEEESRRDTIADLAELEGLPNEVAAELRKYRTMAEDQFSSIVGTFDEGLVAFTDPRVANAVSKNEIRFDDLRGDLKGRSKTLYFKVKAEDIERLAPLIRIFFETMTKFLLSKKWDKDNEHMITYLLDEFPRLGKLKEVVKMPALSRGQGVNVYLIAQDAAQIESEYEKAGREEIMSTTAYKIVLTQNSYETAKMISDTIGKRTIEVVSDSRNKNKLNGGSTSHREQAIELIKPQEISSMKKFHCLVLGQFSQETPVKGQLVLWFNDKKLKHLKGTLGDALIYRPKVDDIKENPKIELPDIDILIRNYEGIEEEETDLEEKQGADPLESSGSPTEPEKTETDLKEKQNADPVESSKEGETLEPERIENEPGEQESEDTQKEDLDLDEILKQASESLPEGTEEKEEYTDEVDKFF